MKKVISILLVLVIALSLCACGNKEAEKYIGTYTSTSKGYQYASLNSDPVVETTEELQINKDGTGKLIRKSCTTNDSFDITFGDVLYKWDVKWEVSDGYLVVTGTATRYYALRDDCWFAGIISEGIQEDVFMSYELKGNKLFEAGEGSASFNKVG